jgi:hypothetical protein
MMLNYKVFFVSDANACRTDAEHNATLASLMVMFADVRSTDEMIALLAEGLRFLSGTQDQLHALVGALARFLGVEVLGQHFVGGAAQHADVSRPSAIVSSIAISSASSTGLLCGTDAAILTCFVTAVSRSKRILSLKLGKSTSLEICGCGIHMGFLRSKI